MTRLPGKLPQDSSGLATKSPTQHGPGITPDEVRKFVSYFENSRPGIFSHFSDGANPSFPFDSHGEEAAKLLLLYSSLNQDISEEKLTGIITGLAGKFPEHIFDLTAFSYEILEKEIQKLATGWDWQLLARAPGILRSTCDFFKKHPDYLNWLKSADSTEDLVAEICEDIFFMGKTGVIKYKARTYIQLLMLSHPGLLSGQWQKAGLLPLTRGAKKLLYFLARVGGRSYSPAGPLDELNSFNNYIRELYPRDSYRVHLPFSLYKINLGPGTYVCETRLGGCEKCVLQKECRK